MSRKQRYTKKDPIGHILLRPDMYVGSVEITRPIPEYTAKPTDGNDVIERGTILVSPAMLRIFVEPLSNAIDNVERSRETKTPCTQIKVTIDRETGLTTIWNNGAIVPIETHAKEGCYNHTMLFGQLLTGSNYDDDEERLVAGRNGLGIKLTNVYSSKFTVKGCDPVNKKTFEQTWTENMRKPGKPITKASSLVHGYTQVSWIPDFSRFKHGATYLTGYTDDIIALYTRHVLDAAMLSGVRVYLDGKLLPVKNLREYARLYRSPTDESLFINTPMCQVLLTPATEFETISFVNGVYTRLGGQHVESWTEGLLRPIVDKFNGKGKKSKAERPKISIKDVREFFRIFVVAKVVRPKFDGQNKNKLESPVVIASVKKAHITAINKWTYVTDCIEDLLRAKEIMALRKTERKRTAVNIAGLDPANNAGGKFSKDCSLFICEGLSAKTYVVAGIDTGLFGRQGRDWFGILPVTGKLLNVRNHTITKVTTTKVVVSLIQTLGLTYDLDYTTEEAFRTLRYGRIVIVADADVDGIHIEGLIMNLIHSLFPTLLQRKESYIISMKTPIARVFRGRAKDLLFYDERRFNDYLANQENKVNAKYYKGLGTTREEDVPDTFGAKLVAYQTDDDAGRNMDKVFRKEFADDRKEWLSGYDPAARDFSLDDTGKMYTMSISSFLDGEMIKFSHADCARSIPSGVDGLKESQRKILYAVRKRNLRFGGNSLKVAQLSGYTAEHSNYHHGEENLQDTIIGMASGFVGANNIPLLYPDGGFGTRLEGGKDAASARYIYTKLEALTHLIFRSEDDPLLTLVNDDGDLVQPEHYIPIVPMILVNGCPAGIGTGWSCTVPCYDPKDLIDAIKSWIKNDCSLYFEDPRDQSKVSVLPELTPWYRGFKGEISGRDQKGRFKTEGVLVRTKKNSVDVTELPIGLWTNKFKEMCEDLVVKKKLKSIKNYSTTQEVLFHLSETPNGVSCNQENMKLHSYLHTSNMALFNAKGQLKKYETVDEVIDDFCQVRLSAYEKRKSHQISALERQLGHLGNKQRFIQEVINKKLMIMNRLEADIVKKLQKRGYDEDPKDGGYNYLLRLPVRIFTVDKVEELENEIAGLHQQLKDLRETVETAIWIRELDELEKAYDKWLREISKRVLKAKTKGKSKR